MQRMGFATGLSTPSMSEWKAYDELFDDKLTASNIEALDALLNDAGKDRAAEMQGHLLDCIAAHTLVYTICVIFKAELVC